MKKFLLLISLLLFGVLLAPGAICIEIEPVSDGVIYYSPQKQLWTQKANSDDAIKLTKKGTKYYQDKQVLFELPSQYNFIAKGQFVAVNNNKLKFYTAIYKNGKFKPAVMSADYVQAIFDDTKVVPVSKFENGVATILRTPFQVEQFLLVNDTDMDFTDYRFSPTSIQHSPIKGIFVARRVGAVHFVKNGDVYKKYPTLTIKIKNDSSKYANPQPIRVLQYRY